MESHILMLRDWVEKARRSGEEEDVYVWWGKIRSARRQTALEHIEDILSIEKDLGEAEGEVQREVQLYLTDYRSLYVAHIGEITADDVREQNGEIEHVPQMYRQDDRHCDCWFRLWDIRRLVSDDTLAVVDELQKLRNKGYHDMPVSIYGGMVNLPLIVTRPDGARYFEPDVRNRLTDGRYWVEFDGEHSGIGATERDLRENCFGEELWGRLDPGALTFIATARSCIGMWTVEVLPSRTALPTSSSGRLPSQRLAALQGCAVSDTHIFLSLVHNWREHIKGEHGKCRTRVSWDTGDCAVGRRKHVGGRELENPKIGVSSSSGPACLGARVST
jgi:hypothetical protein